MPTPFALHPRHRLDLRLGHLALGLAGLGVRRPCTTTVLERAGVADDGLVAASVRSGWLLLLETVAWPMGSKVLVSAVTHPEMAALVTASGLVPVGVDVDLATLLPTPEALEAACTPATRAVLVAQLFGARADLGALARWCDSRGLLLVEDAAQAWTGRGSLRSAADVTLVSFGLLKTATAVGGAVLRVGDPTLRTRMDATARTWPVQPRRAYAVRLLRALLMLGLARRPVYGTFLAACRRLGHDPDAVLDTLSRPRGSGDLVTRLRRRPCAPLLALLARRLDRQDPSCARVRARRAVGEDLRAGLGGAGLPGDRVRDRSHWLFPVRAADPAGLARRLREVGVDASGATSNLVALSASGAAADLMTHVVYVPAYPELPEAARAAVRQVLHSEAAGVAAREVARAG